MINSNKRLRGHNERIIDVYDKLIIALNNLHDYLIMTEIDKKN